MTSLEFEGEVNKSRSIFQLDPDASLAFISTELAKKLKINKITEIEPKEIEVACGTRYTVSPAAIVEFRLDKVPHVTFTETFHLLPGNLAVIILGSPFLLDEGVLIEILKFE